MSERHHRLASRRVNPEALARGDEFAVLRVGPVYASNGEELPGNVTDVSQLHEMVRFFREAQEPTGDLPLIDWNHSAVGGGFAAAVAHPEAQIPIGAVIDMRVDEAPEDGGTPALMVTPAWTKRGRRIVDEGEGLLHPSAAYSLDPQHDRVSGQLVSGAALFAFALTPTPATRPDQLGAVRGRSFGQNNVPAFCVVAELPEQVAKDWPATDSPPHVTLLYFQPADEAEAEAARAVLEQYAAEGQPFGMTLTGGVHTFAPGPHSEGKIPVVAAVQSTGAVEFHGGLGEELVDAGIGYAEGFGYVPHATLAYATTTDEAAAVRPPARAEWTVNTLSLWRGPEAIAIPLNSAATAAQPAPERQTEEVPMGLQELLAAFAALPAADQAAFMAEAKGEEPEAEPEARGEGPESEEEMDARIARAVARNPIMVRAQKLVAEADAKAAAADEAAKLDTMVARGQATPAEIGTYAEPGPIRLCLRAEAAGQGKAFTTMYAGRKPNSVVNMVSVGQGGGGGGGSDAPPTTRNGFTDFAKRNRLDGESVGAAVKRIGGEFPDEFLGAFGYPAKQKVGG